MKQLLLVLLAVSILGCATKKFVQEEVHKMNTDVSTRIEGVQKGVEQSQEEIKTLHQKDSDIEAQMAKLSDSSKDAMNRAKDAQKLAEGKFLYEVTLSDDKVHFGSNKAVLSDEAKAALDAFAQMLKSQNKNVYIEIQGHTDDRGTDELNAKLGEKRAEAVKEYLNMAQGIALHRMSVISYGKTKPAVPNVDKDSRSQNRRVVLVVME